jgi:lactoylglutathione lyase
VSPPQDLDRWPVTVAFIKDPDGYLIELLQNKQGTRPSLR